MTARTLAYAVLCLTLGAGSASGFAGVSVSIRPDTAYVAPDEVFDLVVHVDSIGTPCSGFENTLAWEGIDLEYLSFQPESLLSSLSWSEWEPPHLFPDSTHIFIVIYSFQGFLDEPGPLYSFTFRARQLGETPVRFSLARFGSAYGGGIFPVLRHDAQVYITDPASGISDRDSGSGAAAPGRLRVVPNPLPGAGTIEWDRNLGGGVLELFDLTGRRLSAVSLAAGFVDEGPPAAIAWSDLCPPGAIGPGVYLLRQTGAAHRSTTRVVVTR